MPLPSPLHFTELLACDVFRDGGSLEATLCTPSGDVLSLALEIDRGSSETPRHGNLYECALAFVKDATPVPLGGERERAILDALDDLLRRTEAATSAPYERLRHLRAEVPRRTGAMNSRYRGAPENRSYSDGTLAVVAILTIVPGRLEAFRAYERQAATIMTKHGGVIERAVYVPGEPAREVHVIRFSGAEAFATYRADATLASLATLRDSVIATTEVLLGESGPSYRE